jgi:hypothetical protein
MMILMTGWRPCHVVLPHHAHVRYSPDLRVAWYCSGFAVPWCQVTSHYCLPVVCLVGLCHTIAVLPCQCIVSI